MRIILQLLGWCFQALFQLVTWFFQALFWLLSLLATSLWGLISPRPKGSEFPERTERRSYDYRGYKGHLFQLQSGICNGCEVRFPERNLTIDHIVPLKWGGSNEEVVREN